MTVTVCLPATEVISIDAMASVDTVVWRCRLCDQGGTWEDLAEIVTPVHDSTHLCAGAILTSMQGASECVFCCCNITAMDTRPEGQLLSMVSELCEPLHRAFEYGVERSVECRRLAGLSDRTYDWLGTHQARALAHQHLLDAQLGGWKLVGKHSRNGELWLAHGLGLTTLRMLHASSTEDVPAPGPNWARRAYYCNDPLLGMETGVTHHPALFDVNTMLGLWRVIDWTTFRVAIRIVRTIGTWKYRARALTDLDVMLPRLVDDFGNLEWTPNDFGMELNIPAGDDMEEGEEGGAAD